MPTPKPAAQTIFPWLRANLGNRCLAPLTGTDARALKAAVQIVELYSVHADEEIARAFQVVVLFGMQSCCRYLAYHAIAHVMDWSHRDELWRAANLDPLTNFPRCANEPGGSKRPLATSTTA